MIETQKISREVQLYNFLRTKKVTLRVALVNIRQNIKFTKGKIQLYSWLDQAPESCRKIRSCNLLFPYIRLLHKEQGP